MKSKKQIYMKRRLIALLIISLFFLVVIGIISIKIKNKASKSSEPNEVEAVDTNLSKYISNRPVKAVNELLDYKYGLNMTEYSNEISKDLLVYRQNLIKEQSMGRTDTSQSLLNKQVYLTFDDGPSPVTEDVLDVLKDYNVKATFFVIGKNVDNYPQLLERIYNEGHDIGLHTYTHDYKSIYANKENLAKDINLCLQAIRNVLGEDFNTNLYRFPGGSFGRDEFKPLIKEMGYVYFDWNTLNGDGEGHGQSVKELVDRYEDTAEGYNVQIALMHDSSLKQSTADSLPYIIESLQEEGYEFKTLGDI